MIESILSFFALWGIGFWLLMLATSIVFIFSCEQDTIGVSLVATGILAIIYHPIIFTIMKNPILLGILFASWVIIGVLWSMWRWHKFVTKCLKEKHTEYEISVSWNKSRIIGWIIYWPWSMFWNLFSDFFQSIYEMMSGVYESILEKAIAKAKLNNEKQ